MTSSFTFKHVNGPITLSLPSQKSPYLEENYPPEDPSISPPSQEEIFERFVGKREKGKRFTMRFNPNIRFHHGDLCRVSVKMKPFMVKQDSIRPKIDTFLWIDKSKLIYYPVIAKELASETAKSLPFLPSRMTAEDDVRIKQHIQQALFEYCTVLEMQLCEELRTLYRSNERNLVKTLTSLSIEDVWAAWEQHDDNTIACGRYSIAPGAYIKDKSWMLRCKDASGEITTLHETGDIKSLMLNGYLLARQEGALPCDPLLAQSFISVNIHQRRISSSFTTAPFLFENLVFAIKEEGDRPSVCHNDLVFSAENDLVPLALLERTTTTFDLLKKLATYQKTLLSQGQKEERESLEENRGCHEGFIPKRFSQVAPDLAQEAFVTEDVCREQFNEFQKTASTSIQQYRDLIFDRLFKELEQPLFQEIGAFLNKQMPQRFIEEDAPSYTVQGGRGAFDKSHPSFARRRKRAP